MNPGTKLGSYQILAPLGSGGMGDVFRARDMRLDREVALKMVSAGLARDPERVARFEREAKLLASLNHPNIAAIYGVEESGPAPALVMELVEGPTLADRIKAGPLPVDEAVRIARQIADGLEYAHERGVVHRDLKPANIKVAPDDSVKILDFGLAKVIAGEAIEADMATSPTLTRMATQAGYIIGTAAYMSPEQAKGKPVDRRADIWAFGCVLFEMLSGKIAFQGETITDTLAAVVRAEPDWSLLPAATPLRVRVLLGRCLQKDPKQRLRDIGDARISIDEVLSGAPLEAGVPAEVSKAVPRRQPILWTAAVVLIAVAAGAAVWFLKPASVPRKPVSRFTITLPLGDQFVALDYPGIALSPDGTQLAYSAVHSGMRQLYLRALDNLEAKPVPDTEGAFGPFFSPDGQSLGFYAAARLRKIPLAGGAAVTLTTDTVPYGADWSPQGMILLAPNIGPIEQIPDTGGALQPLTHLALDRGESLHGWPSVLPGGQAFLFIAGPSPQRIVVQSLSSGERRDLGLAGASPRYAASGHLVYVQDGNLMAVGFDPSKLQLAGTPQPVVQGVMQLSNGAAQYSISATGSLAYIPGSAAGANRQLVWVSRNGTEQTLPASPHTYVYPHLSPDGRMVAVSFRDQSSQTWLYDFGRDSMTRLTFSGTENEMPVWTRDGKRIAHISNQDGPVNIYWQPADGSGGLERLTNTRETEVPSSFSPDGQLLAYVDINAATGYDIWILHLADRKAEPFIKTPFSESSPRFSPDGHWLAYVSDESGRYEIYVQPYPGPGGKYQISTDGGGEPVWNPNGKELFYRSGDKMMAAEITTTPSFSVGKSKMLFQGPYTPTTGTFPFYDVSPDGQRFLMLKPAETAAAATQIVVVENWFEELKRLVPPAKQSIP
jgi:eukaryotic-like serine/threonine-protein kinase